MIDKDGFGTHQPFLRVYIERTDGNILEFGTGNFSTTFILDYLDIYNKTHNTNRKLISIENNLQWLNKMKELHPENKNHQYIYVDESKYSYTDFIHNFPKYDWSIVFIDQTPWEARNITMQHFKDSAKYILIHDVDYFPKNNIFGSVINNDENSSSYNFDDICPSRNWKLYYPLTPYPVKTGPPLLVFSNTNEKIYTINLSQQDNLINIQYF